MMCHHSLNLVTFDSSTGQEHMVAAVVPLQALPGLLRALESKAAWTVHQSARASEPTGLTLKENKHCMQCLCRIHIYIYIHTFIHGNCVLYIYIF